MAARAADKPAGRVLQVFSTGAERQGAYDFLANDAIEPAAVSEAVFESTARRCSESRDIVVALDGSSISVVDENGTKGFGVVGSLTNRGSGLKVVTAYAMDADGTPVGVLDQQWWCRERIKRKKDADTRPLEQVETWHWTRAIAASTRRLASSAARTNICFVMDREADGRHFLEAARDSGHGFIVRSATNRRLLKRSHMLLDELRSLIPVFVYELDVPAAEARRARVARMVVRATRVALRMRNRNCKQWTPFELNVVQAREEGTTPPGERPIEWRLLTNLPIGRRDAAAHVIDTYMLRWRIEEFHKTWKSGACNIEDSQLRHPAHLVKWATIMAAVAARIERLKILSRTSPDLPASGELSLYEIGAILTLKRSEKRRNEIIPLESPTIGKAVLWLAELGGYTGKSSGGPPGAITIRRGLERIGAVAAAIKQLERDGKMR